MILRGYTGEFIAEGNPVLFYSVVRADAGTEQTADFRSSFLDICLVAQSCPGPMVVDLTIPCCKSSCGCMKGTLLLSAPELQAQMIGRLYVPANATFRPYLKEVGGRSQVV